MENIEKKAMQIKEIASKRAQSVNAIPKGVYYYPGWCLIDTRNKMSEKEVFKLYLKSIFLFPGVYLGYLLDKLKPHLNHLVRCIVYAFFFTLTLYFFGATTSILSGETVKLDESTAFDGLWYITLVIGVICFFASGMISAMLRSDRYIADIDDREFEILTIVSNIENGEVRIANAVRYSNDKILTIVSNIENREVGIANTVHYSNARMLKDFFTRIASETDINVINLEVAYSRLSFLERVLLVENSFEYCSDKRKNITSNDLRLAKEYLFRDYIITMLKKRYPKGTRVRLLKNDWIITIPVGTLGTVSGVNAGWGLVVKWDNGATTVKNHGKDEIQIVK